MVDLLLELLEHFGLYLLIGIVGLLIICWSFWATGRMEARKASKDKEKQTAEDAAPAVDTTDSLAAEASAENPIEAVADSVLAGLEDQPDISTEQLENTRRINLKQDMTVDEEAEAIKNTIFFSVPAADAMPDAEDAAAAIEQENLQQEDANPAPAAVDTDTSAAGSVADKPFCVYCGEFLQEDDEVCPVCQMPVGSKNYTVRPTSDSDFSLPLEDDLDNDSAMREIVAGATMHGLEKDSLTAEQVAAALPQEQERVENAISALRDVLDSSSSDAEAIAAVAAAERILGNGLAASSAPTPEVPMSEAETAPSATASAEEESKPVAVQVLEDKLEEAAETERELDTEPSATSVSEPVSDSFTVEPLQEPQLDSEEELEEELAQLEQAAPSLQVAAKLSSMKQSVDFWTEDMSVRSSEIDQVRRQYTMELQLKQKKKKKQAPAAEEPVQIVDLAPIQESGQAVSGVAEGDVLDTDAPAIDPEPQVQPQAMEIPSAVADSPAFAAAAAQEAAEEKEQQEEDDILSNIRALERRLMEELNINFDTEDLYRKRK